MQKTSQNGRTTIDKTEKTCYNTIMKNNATTTKEKKMTFRMTKRIIKAQFCVTVEIIRNGEVVRRFECATLTEARRCE